MEDYIEEKDLENYQHKMNKEQLQVIFLHMEKSICKIKCLVNVHGIGFFIIISIFDDWNSSLRALMTNNHFLNKNEIMGKTIKCSLNNGNVDYEITIDNSRRKIYSSENSFFRNRQSNF